mmetsp:Transcript_42573/g.99775  ORF Transcript_42573/g.99775 Transcript_42573/m.99775 type:complete len:234 (-) Transcript_42573:364-1065(-)
MGSSPVPPVSASTSVSTPSGPSEPITESATKSKALSASLSRQSIRSGDGVSAGAGAGGGAAVQLPLRRCASSATTNEFTCCRSHDSSACGRPSFTCGCSGADAPLPDTTTASSTARASKDDTVARSTCAATHGSCSTSAAGSAVKPLPLIASRAPTATASEPNDTLARSGSTTGGERANTDCTRTDTSTDAFSAPIAARDSRPMLSALDGVSSSSADTESTPEMRSVPSCTST